jgi:DNA excision repair protein ERCC-4
MLDTGIPLDPTATVSSVVGNRDILPHFDEIPPPEIITVRQYVGEDDTSLLEQMQPKFIIMYDPNPAFVRRVEVRVQELLSRYDW